MIEFVFAAKITTVIIISLNLPPDNVESFRRDSFSLSAINTSRQDEDGR